MTDQILATSAQASVACAQLPEQEIGLARREMVNTSGGLLPPIPLPLARLIAEIIKDYLDDGD